MKKGLLANTSTGGKIVTIGLAFIVGAVLALLGTAAVMAVFQKIVPHHSITDSAEGLRILQTLSALFLFTLPPLLAEWFLSESPIEALSLDQTVPSVDLLLGLGCLVAAVPFISWIEELNRAVTFPPSLQGLEEWFLSKEEMARNAVEQITAGASAGDIVSSFLVIAVLAGVSEEILFRGFIQNRLERWSNPHVAVWVTAFVFSAIHVQFYGFVPRLLLGAFLGYLLVWSRSLWLPIALHIANNAIYLLFQLLMREKILTFDLESFQWSQHPVWLALSVPLMIGAIVLFRRRLLRQSCR